MTDAIIEIPKFIYAYQFYFIFNFRTKKIVDCICKNS